jgi:hypothetical protein
MYSKYQPIQPEDEKFQDVFPPNRLSISTSDLTLLEDEEDSRLTESQSGFNSKWMWLAHAVLLSLSFSMFVAAYFKPVSTLTHVQHFSAFCKSHHLKGYNHALI